MSRDALHRISDGDYPGARLSLPTAAEAALPSILVAAMIGQLALWFATGVKPSSFGLSAAAVDQGRWWTLVSYMFIHAGFYHLFANASVASALTPRVLGGLGRGPASILRFAVFYLACGVAAGAGWLAAHPHGAMPVVGASGAISGLFGAAVRQVSGGVALTHPFSRTVWRQAKPFLLANVVLMAFLDLIGVPIAWEAHLVGFLFGLLAYGWFRPAQINPNATAGEACSST